MVVVNRPSPFLTAAIDAASQSGARLRAMVSDSWDAKGVTTKRNPADLVTRADRMSEELIVGVLRARFSDHGVLAEEGTAYAGEEYRWIIDPIDGTTNFAHGLPLFAVSIALEHKGDLVAGVVYHPSMDELFAAERGRGAFLRRDGRDEPLTVSGVRTVAESVVATGLPYDIRETGRNVTQIGSLTRTAIEVRILGAAALHLAYVAAGRVEAFWEPGLSPWDIAAGALLVQEAGGRISDMQGAPFHVDCRDVLASNGRVHTEMLGLLRA
jgi:myo-inositol-1(or 4)-monophosphatase